MKLVVFGLTLSSSWGNGHATLWRGICRALAAGGHEVVFFERDVPYYAAHRDLHATDACALHLYADWERALPRARAELADADAGIVTSYCPDALAATDLVLGGRGLAVFYDLDTGVTLERLERGQRVDYLGPDGLAGFDLVLSYTGGAALAALEERLGARRAVPLYGCVDPEAHRPAERVPGLAGDLSYLGTYAADRQEALERLFLAPARRLPARRFVLGGSMYPPEIAWPANVQRVWHVPPAEHSAFYCSSALTLNVTRAAMARLGWCPSGRLFEAAACGVPVLSDSWPGLDRFFAPGEEILVAATTEEAIAALSLPRERLAAVGRAARARALAEHTAARRAAELLAALGAERAETLVPRRAAAGAGALLGA